jgi:hypothetical protein
VSIIGVPKEVVAHAKAFEAPVLAGFVAGGVDHPAGFLGEIAQFGGDTPIFEHQIREIICFGFQEGPEGAQNTEDHRLLQVVGGYGAASFRQNFLDILIAGWPIEIVLGMDKPDAQAPTRHS